jgi:SPP1 family predicted phage head-tail adaptor
MLNHKEQIGKLDERITFQFKVVGANESNEDEEIRWENIPTDATVYASKDERGGGESYRADKLTAYGGVIFTCRYRTDITARNRIVCRGIPYNIIAPPVEVGRRRFLKIECESGGEFIGVVTTNGAFNEGFNDGFDI